MDSPREPRGDDGAVPEPGGAQPPHQQDPGQPPAAPWPDGGHYPYAPPQPGSGYHPYAPPQPGGYYPQPYPSAPPPRRAGVALAAAVTGIVAVLATLAITGFVAPGFFLDDSDDRGNSGVAEDVAPGDSPQALVQAVVDGINAKDKAALSALACEGASDDVEEIVMRVDDATSARQKHLDVRNDRRAFASVVVETRLGTLVVQGDLHNDNGSWCLDTVYMGSGDPATTTATPS